MTIKTITTFPHLFFVLNYLLALKLNVGQETVKKKGTRWAEDQWNPKMFSKLSRVFIKHKAIFELTGRSVKNLYKKLIEISKP